MKGDPRQFRDRVAIITGGGSGVGLACAAALVAEGASVLITGRNAQTLIQACSNLGSDSSYLSGDITDPATAVAAVQAAHDRFGTHPSLLVNNAGTILRKSAQDTSDQEWADVMAVNVTGPFNFSRAFAGVCADDSAIVNVSSTCGQVGAAGLAAYCASKGALDQLTRAMALELAPRRITVNAVAPGAINSPMLFSQHSDPRDAETVVKRNLGSIPIGSVAEPEDIARAILYLAREPHITGTILSVDGGYTAV